MSHTLAIGSKTLAYTKTGQGPAVLIVHGIGGHKEDWAGLAQTLAPKHTVYAVDMLGFGGSSKTGDQITIDEQAAALVALMDEQGVKTADVVGNSVGGWVAATLAAGHPDRVRKLVLVDAAGFKAMFEGQPPVDFYPQDVAAMSKLLSYVRYAPETHNDAYAETALEASKATGDAQAAAAVGKGMFVSARLEDVADKVAAPTLVIWGAEDKLFPPPVADLVSAHVKGSHKVLIPNASHFPQLDNPELFNRTVAEFLAG
jgi:pimeloyl-ACP methyl ester carboxylesterase